MCVRPITIFNRAARPWSRTGSIQVPCGKCIECVMRYQNDWSARMIEEMKYRKIAHFVTLTYNEKSVPWAITQDGEANRSVCVSDIQKWIKRFRAYLVRDCGVDSSSWSYFLCSEYGPSTFRPHYHCIFFGLSRSLVQHALADWTKNYGYTKYRLVGTSPEDREKASSYVAKYCCKGELECPLVRDRLVVRPFRLMSKGIGKSYIDRMLKWHLCLDINKSQLKRYDKNTYRSSHLGYTDELLERIYTRCLYYKGGVPCALPRYYKDKILNPKSNLAFAYSAFLFEKASDDFNTKLRQVRDANPTLPAGEEYLILARQTDSELKERERLKLERLNRFYRRSCL